MKKAFSVSLDILCAKLWAMPPKREPERREESKIKKLKERIEAKLAAKAKTDETGKTQRKNK